MDTSWLERWRLFEDTEELLRSNTGIRKGHFGGINSARIPRDWYCKQEYSKSWLTPLQSISRSKGEDIGGVQGLGNRSWICRYESYMSCLLLLGYWILQNDLSITIYECWSFYGSHAFSFSFFKLNDRILSLFCLINTSISSHVSIISRHCSFCSSMTFIISFLIVIINPPLIEIY